MNSRIKITNVRIHTESSDPENGFGTLTARADLTMDYGTMLGAGQLGTITSVGAVVHIDDHQEDYNARKQHEMSNLHGRLMLMGFDYTDVTDALTEAGQ